MATLLTVPSPAQRWDPVPWPWNEEFDWWAGGTFPDLHYINFSFWFQSFMVLSSFAESLSHLSLSLLSGAKDVCNGELQSKLSLLLKYCSQAHDRPGAVIINNSLWWCIWALHFVLMQFILSYFFGGENGFGEIFWKRCEFVCWKPLLEMRHVSHGLLFAHTQMNC